ncbi:MAG: nitrate reductase molybdenum cofactor assembly chaperone [Asticcacaulis sp.]|nr:nitrate reductase molybdenum cofactor assembly chaperone [Asticcacaulis sp.]
MALTYRGLACLLSYPTPAVKETVDAVSQALREENLLPAANRKAVDALIAEIAAGDLYDLQERYIDIFDRTRSLSLNLYEHVHGESRERGQAMVALLELYRSRGLELDANELPDFLPVFLEFLSILPQAEAASFRGRPCMCSKPWRPG